VILGQELLQHRRTALRIGWLVVPRLLLDAVTEEKYLADRGTARIDQYALGHFLDGGELHRHLRRMRTLYRRRRNALVEALAEDIPEATVEGIAAGLHAVVRLPSDHDETAILHEASRRRIELRTFGHFAFTGQERPPTLLLGYAQSSEPTLRSGVMELADAVRACPRS
jgi:GntR family transcriptional regulator/MocR family aminotransferase